MQSVLRRVYPGLPNSLCLFHINKNIVKILMNNNLSKFIKKCSTDIELWAYSKFRLIMCLPFLPRECIKDHFDTIEKSVVEVLSLHLNSMEMENVLKAFATLKKNYFHKENKIDLMCKFEKPFRTTNIAEGGHSGINKSSLIKRCGNMNSMIQGKFYIIFNL